MELPSGRRLLGETCLSSPAPLAPPKAVLLSNAGPLDGAARRSEAGVDGEARRPGEGALGGAPEQRDLVGALTALPLLRDGPPCCIAALSLS